MIEISNANHTTNSELVQPAKRRAMSQRNPACSLPRTRDAYFTDACYACLPPSCVQGRTLRDALSNGCEGDYYDAGNGRFEKKNLLHGLQNKRNK